MNTLKFKTPARIAPDHLIKKLKGYFQETQDLPFIYSVTFLGTINKSNNFEVTILNRDTDRFFYLLGGFVYKIIVETK